jgi:hypothetical protein
MEIPDALLNTAAALIGGAVGGIITGYYTLKATDKTIRDQNEKEVKREEKQIQNLLDALGVEIKTLWDFHMRRIGGMVENLPAGQALEFYYPLTQDYFTIYNSNAANIGAIKDCEVSEAIVVCYNKCKKVVDGFKYNNELFREYQNAANSMNHEPKRIDAAFKALTDFAQIVKEDHFEVKGYVERLLKLLQED